MSLFLKLHKDGLRSTFGRYRRDARKARKLPAQGITLGKYGAQPTPCRGKKLPARGIALGKYGAQPTPCRGKSVSAMQALLGRAAPR